ncbi:hypothetical protein [Hydrogenovibrio sp. JE_KL2]|uniref:hypothetical protein n=1 Tax=Hydrogenovibrio sp. JE_KL2 TaxID=2651188 RepID=UPI00128CD896|nr:hypothetical protein [Hydrogenovibrio sp. JE_KL2]MPQ76134.1 hypothetical protein [Hydrogenovibrio sp. JE_KL2]
MENEEGYDLINRKQGSLSYLTWYQKLIEFIKQQWKKISLYLLSWFSVLWLTVEVLNFFYPKISLNSHIVLLGILAVSFLVAVVHSFLEYKRHIPLGLENESIQVHKIVRVKKPFWEYALAYELLRERIEFIDQALDDVLNNRVHIKISRVMDIEEYMQWLVTRPENLIKMVEVSKTLLISDLVQAIHPDEGREVNYTDVIRVADLIKDLYTNLYEFEIEGRTIQVPDGFEFVHQIQSGWATVIRDAFHQMLEVLLTVSRRDKGDLSPINGTITFEEPPKIQEYHDELERLCCDFRSNR